MTDRELELRLKALTVPPPRPEQIEIAFDRARRVFQAGQNSPLMNRGKRFVWVAASAFGLAAAIIFVVYVQHENRDPAPSPPMIAEAGSLSDKDWQQIVNEVRTLFPDQMQAVVAIDGELRVILHQHVQPISDQPILVSISPRSGSPVVLVSFSGQTVEAEVEERRVKLELLLTSSQNVLVAGDNFLCTQQNGICLGDLSIQARPLENGS